MPKYRVLLTREASEHAEVIVEADSVKEAREEALEEAGTYGENVNWEVDDGNCREAYLCDGDGCVEELEDEDEEKAPELSDDEMIARIEEGTGGRVLKSDLGGFYVALEETGGTEDYPTIAELYKAEIVDADVGCPADNFSPHTPNWDSVKIHREDDAIYIDVLCENCGRAGCLHKFDFKDEVQW